MDELVLRALDSARVKGAGYADVRVVSTTQERIVVRNGVVETLSTDESLGFGVRVLINGCWGFASSHDFSPTEVDRVTGLAVQIAQASALQNTPDQRLAIGDLLGRPVTSQGTYTTPIEIDPFSVSTEQKLSLLLAADQGMSTVKGIRSRMSNLIFIREEKTFANTEGAYVEQTSTRRAEESRPRR